MSSEEKE
jgi:hypothetical protein